MYWKMNFSYRERLLLKTFWYHLTLSLTPTVLSIWNGYDPNELNVLFGIFFFVAILYSCFVIKEISRMEAVFSTEPSVSISAIEVIFYLIFSSVCLTAFAPDCGSPARNSLELFNFFIFLCSPKKMRNFFQINQSPVGKSAGDFCF